jgi:hypothetical protein
MRSEKWLLVAILGVYLVVAAWAAVNKLPWCDEGWYGGPVSNLLTHASPGTPNFYSAVLPRVRQNTYWEAPGFIAGLTAWCKLIGFGILHVRAFSIFWGAAVLLLWYALLRMLGVQPFVRLLAVLFLSVDYMFVMDATYARADMMSLAFCFAAYAGYHWWRTSNFSIALFAASACAMVAGLTHPNAGLLTLIGLAVFIWPDRSRLRWRHALICAIPFLLGAAAWGLYIARDLEAFRGQMGSNSSGRFSAVLHPLLSIRNEIVLRYFPAYGLGPHTAGTPATAILKVVSLLVELAGLIGCLLIPDLRKNFAVRRLLVVFAAYLSYYTFLEGTRTTYYLIWILPFWTAWAAFSAAWAYSRGPFLRLIALLSVLCMFAVPSGALLFKGLQSPGMRAYHETAAFLRERGAPNSSVFASIEFGYAFGFEEGRYTDDASLGLWSGLRPNYVVIDARWRDDVEAPPPRAHPWSFRSSEKLKRYCDVVFDRQYYRVYQCHGENW